MEGIRPVFCGAVLCGTVPRRNAEKAVPRRSAGGFSLAKTLLSIGLTALLAAAGFASAVSWNTVRQTRLNRSAEQIYMAAQRNLAARKVSGGEMPGADRRVTSDSGADEIEAILVPGTVSPALADGYWVIAYSGWLVDRVCYSETENIAEWPAERWAAWEAEPGRGEKVGQYGGTDSPPA